MSESGEIEFNSMVAILKRLDRITYQINDNRQLKNYPAMLDSIIDYFKEVSSDLNLIDMKNTWEKIKRLKLFCGGVIPERRGKLLTELDELDMTIRFLAKKHGYLTKQKANAGAAIIDL